MLRVLLVTGLLWGLSAPAVTGSHGPALPNLVKPSGGGRAEGQATARLKQESNRRKTELVAAVCTLASHPTTAPVDLEGVSESLKVKIGLQKSTTKVPGERLCTSVKNTILDDLTADELETLVSQVRKTVDAEPWTEELTERVATAKSRVVTLMNLLKGAKAGFDQAYAGQILKLENPPNEPIEVTGSQYVEYWVRVHIVNPLRNKSISASDLLLVERRLSEMQDLMIPIVQEFVKSQGAK